MEINEKSIYDYSSPVQKVLLEPNLMAGIGVIPAMFILVITIVLMNVISIWCALLGVILYLVARLLSKKDPYMLTILFDRILEPNIWRI